MSEENKPKSRQDDIVQKEKPVEEALAVVEEAPQRPTIEEPVLEKSVENTTKVPLKKGIDVGTNTIIASKMSDDASAVFTIQRDCFLRIVPKSEVNKNSIKMSLDKRYANYFIDEDGSFIVIGQDALDIAIERNEVAERPLQKGVISPKNKRSLPILKRIIKDLVGTTDVPDSKIVYSIPASPVDDHFDIVYHTEIIGNYFKDLGYVASPINEAFAVALSELLDDGLTGISVSYGAGMTNICVIHQGDPLIEFSLTRSGDYIDQSVGRALDMSPSLIQQEKEMATDLTKPQGEIQEAISVYYNNVIKYTLENIAYELNSRKKGLPVFRDSVPLVIAGGLSAAKGFTKKVEDIISTLDFPIKISEVRLAEEPLTAVSNGCLLAAHL